MDFNLSPSSATSGSCLVLEDSLRGIEAASRAGISVIGLATTPRPSDARRGGPGGGVVRGDHPAI